MSLKECGEFVRFPVFQEALNGEDDDEVRSQSRQNGCIRRKWSYAFDIRIKVSWKTVRNF